jgi:hypothetical protein
MHDCTGIMANLIERVTIALAKGNVYADLDRVLCDLHVLGVGAASGAHPTDAVIHQTIARHSLGPKNRCLACGMDMGINNPRQLCGKTYCLYEFME